MPRNPSNPKKPFGRRVYLTLEEIEHIQNALDILEADVSGMDDERDQQGSLRYKEVVKANSKLNLKLSKALERKNV